MMRRTFLCNRSSPWRCLIPLQLQLPIGYLQVLWRLTRNIVSSWQRASPSYQAMHSPEYAPPLAGSTGTFGGGGAARGCRDGGGPDDEGGVDLTFLFLLSQ